MLGPTPGWAPRQVLGPTPGAGPNARLSSPSETHAIGIRLGDALRCSPIAARFCDRGSGVCSHRGADKSAILRCRSAKAPSGVGRHGLLSREVLSGEATAVFENSTACAPTIEIDRGVRPGSTRHGDRFGVPGGGKESSREVPRHGGTSVYGSRPPMTAFCGARDGFGRPFESKEPSRLPLPGFGPLHGEFDPGSGRTLAACLTHASGATNQGLPWGRAANG
jgi:hypothetical protein